MERRMQDGYTSGMNVPESDRAGRKGSSWRGMLLLLAGALLLAILVAWLLVAPYFHRVH